ncbi:hypothetical protein J1605_003822 [Eschrichtius robustus]|uniref:GBD/FH3 domain-containing protein n=1 Tax=Eschrichtius robustus TaxID=9764 RepID=A0AB34HQL4_ESCRO|nr:hypothetical protein J1605_003822 [Eschrichtius robustus]
MLILLGRCVEVVETAEHERPAVGVGRHCGLRPGLHPPDSPLLGSQFKRRVQESTQVLRELETSLRTNHIGWVQEFLNEENRGLDVLLEYLAFVQCSVTYYMESTDNGAPGSEKSKPLEQSVEDLSKGPPSSLLPQPKSRHLTIKLTPAHSRKALRNSRIVSQKDDVHVCIMCLRAIMNYQSGFSLVMNHPACVNEIALSLNNKNPRTKALVLELLAAVCLVRGGHDIILSAFDNFKEVCGEQHRFEKLMEYFRNEDSNIDFMVSSGAQPGPGHPRVPGAVRSLGIWDLGSAPADNED